MATEIKETRHYSFTLWPAVTSHCAQSERKQPMAWLVSSSSQWPDKRRENVILRALGCLLPPSQSRCMRLQLMGRLKFPREAASDSDGQFIKCLLLCVRRVAAFFQAGQKHVGRSRMIPTPAHEQSEWGVGREGGGGGALRIRGPHSRSCMCSLLLSSWPPTNTLLTNARCYAQISRHSANLQKDLTSCFVLLFFLLSETFLSSPHLYQHFFSSALMMRQADCSVHKAIYSQLKSYSPQGYYDTLPEPSQWCGQTFQKPEEEQPQSQRSGVVPLWARRRPIDWDRPGCFVIKRYIGRCSNLISGVKNCLR